MDTQEKPVEETEITESSETPSDNSDDQKNGDAAAVEQPKRETRSERRINKLTARNYELQEGNEKLQAQLNDLSQKVDTLAPKAVRPQREEFENLEDYEDAVMDYRIDVRAPKTESPKPKEPEPVIDHDLAKRFDGFIADSEKASPGFEKVVANAHFPLTDHSLTEIMDMGGEGAEVFTHLNSNPTEAMRISQLSPRNQTIELEKLADSLDATSSAPEPIKPLKGGDHPTVDESKLSSDQRIRKRQKDVADRQRSIRKR